MSNPTADLLLRSQPAHSSGSASGEAAPVERAGLSEAQGTAESPGSPGHIAPEEFLSKPSLMLPRVRVHAFARSPSLIDTLERAARDRRALKSEFEVREGDFPEAMAHYAECPPGDLVLIEDVGGGEQLQWSIDALAEYCPPSTRLVVIGHRNDVGLYRALIRMGVSDYLVQPLSPLALLNSITSIFAEGSDAQSLGQVLAFIGARGGVGSSTIAHNVSAALSKRFAATTLLVDADVRFGTASLQFDIVSPYSFADAVKEGADLNREMLEKLVYWRDKRFGILTSPDNPDQMAPPESGVTRHVIEQARRLAQYVVLDLPQGLVPWSVEALTIADRVALVANPDLPSLRNAQRIFGVVQKIRPNDAPPELVLNRIPVRARPSVSADNFSRILERKVAVQIPCDPAAGSAEMAGQVLVESKKASAAATAIQSLAAQMSGRDPVGSGRGQRKPLLGRLFARGRK